MLSMLAWTLMTAMVVMNAKSHTICPTSTNLCVNDNDACGKDVSGSCSSICNCKNGQPCSTDSSHTIILVPRYTEDGPYIKNYYTCVDPSELVGCAGAQKSVNVSVSEAQDPNSAQVLCYCPPSKINIWALNFQHYICVTPPQP
nr:TPA_inf: conotoxin precursor Tpra06 [Conus ebraeus]